MAKFEPQEVEPRKYEVSRRRFLRNAGMVASVPFLGGLAEILGERGASAQTYRDESHPLFASHPPYKFTFVNHVTTNPFFTATQYGLQDAARILGIPTPQWTGSTGLGSLGHGERDRHRDRREGERHLHHPHRPDSVQYPGRPGPGHRHSGCRVQRRRAREQPNVLHRTEQPHRRCRCSGADCTRPSSRETSSEW